MRYLLDTSALLAHYRQETGGEMVQALFEADEAEIIMACVSLPEFGRRLLDLGAPESVVQETLASYQLLCTEVAPLDAAVALAAFAIGGHTPRRLPVSGCAHRHSRPSAECRACTSRSAHARHSARPAPANRFTAPTDLR